MSQKAEITLSKVKYECHVPQVVTWVMINIKSNKAVIKTLKWKYRYITMTTNCPENLSVLHFDVISKKSSRSEIEHIVE